VRLHPGFGERPVQQLAVNKCSLVVDRSIVVNKGQRVDNTCM
jgi:hypothetical protein